MKFLSLTVVLLCSAASHAIPVKNTPPQIQSVSKSSEKAPVILKKVTEVRPQLALNSATFAGNDSGNTKSKMAPSLGVAVDVDINQNDLMFETGVLYNNTGAILPVDSDVLSLSLDLNLSYFSFPAYAKWYYTQKNNTAAYAKAGFVTSFLVSKDLTATIGNEKISSSNFEIKNFDVAPSVGLGMHIGLLPNASLVLEASYTRGLLSVIDKKEVFNSVLAFTAGVTFNQ